MARRWSPGLGWRVWWEQSKSGSFTRSNASFRKEATAAVVQRGFTGDDNSVEDVVVVYKLGLSRVLQVLMFFPDILCSPKSTLSTKSTAE